MPKDFTPSKYSPGLDAAIAAAGGVSKLARLLGLVPSAVTNWRTIPLRRVGQVSAATGISKQVLCPEHFSPEIVA